MSNFYVGEVLFETGGTIDTPGDINVTAICDCSGSTGTAGQLLSSTGTALEWITAGSAGIPCSILTAKGTIVTASAPGTPAALPVGTFGQVLLADSGCATGLKWGSLPTASVTGLGVMYGCVTSSAPNNTSVGYFTLAFGSTTCTIAVGNNSMIGAQGDSHIAIGVSIGSTGSGTGCNIAIGNGIGGGNFQASLENVIIGQYAGCVCVSASSKNVIIGAKAAQTLNTACNNVAIGYGVTPPTPTSDCTLAIGYDTGCHWLTGTSTKAIQPGAGIIDCAGSCGTNGQVLMSNGANAICWGTVSGGGGIPPSTLTAKGDLITATAASTPTALNVGSNGQVLTACSTCSSGLVWATPPSVYQITTSSTYSFTAGVPVNVLNFGNSNSLIDGLLTLPVNAGLVNSVWKFVKSGDPTNFNTGWNPYFQWPTPSTYDPGYFSMLYPVYPDPLAGNMILEYTPASNQTSQFTLVFSAIQGAAPTWMI